MNEEYLFKVKDTVVIPEGLARMVHLVDLRPATDSELEEAPWKCHVHAGPNTSPENGSRILQPVYLEIETLSKHVQMLLESHGGILPLLRWERNWFSENHVWENEIPFSNGKCFCTADYNEALLTVITCVCSFVECYEARFPPLVVEPRRGVALELLLRSIPSLAVRDLPSRHIMWQPEGARAISPPDHLSMYSTHVTSVTFHLPQKMFFLFNVYGLLI